MSRPYRGLAHSEQAGPHLLRGIQTSAWPSFTVISPHVTQSRLPPTCYEAYRPLRGPLLLLFHPMSLRAGHPPPATRHTDLHVALFYCYFTPCHSEQAAPPTCYEAYRPPCGPLFHPMSLRAGHPPPATRHTDLCVALFYCYFTPCHSEQAAPHLLRGIQTSMWPSFTVISPHVTQSRPPPHLLRGIQTSMWPSFTVISPHVTQSRPPPTCYEAYRPPCGPLFHPMSLRAGHPPPATRHTDLCVALFYCYFTPCHSEQAAPHLLRGIQTSMWPIISPHVTQSRPPPTCYEAYRPLRGPLLLLFHPMSLRAGHPPTCYEAYRPLRGPLLLLFHPMSLRAGHPPPATRHTDLCVGLFYCYFTPCHSEQATPHLLRGIQTSAWPSFTVISPHVTQSRPPPHLLRGIQTSMWPSFTIILPHVPI